jgi:hypothetical protein
LLGRVPLVVAEPHPDARPTEDDGFIERLYAEHGPALLRYALGLTGGDTQRAEDLVQEAMLRAWRSETPQVRAGRWFPQVPTDNSAFSGTHRHGCYSSSNALAGLYTDEAAD